MSRTLVGVAGSLAVRVSVEAVFVGDLEEALDERQRLERGYAATSTFENSARPLCTSRPASAALIRSAATGRNGRSS